MKRGFILKKKQGQEQQVDNPQDMSTITNATSVIAPAQPSLASDTNKLINVATSPVDLAGHPDAQIIDFFKVGDRSQAKVSLHSSTKLDYPGNALIAIHLPSGSGASGTECVIHARVKSKILSTLGFPSPPPHMDSQNPAYEIKPTATMGLGMFATRPLKTGDMILVERPFLATPYNIDVAGIPECSPDLRNLMKNGHPATGLQVMEGMLQLAFGRMSEENQKAYLALSNMHLKDGSEQLTGISRTNGFGFDLGDKEGYLYSAVLNEMSRINHSCVPNCAHTFDMASFTFQLRAGKNIAKGEEIFYNYTREDSTFGRQTFLRCYGIKCTCAACSRPTSDAIRTTAKSRVSLLEERLKGLRINKLRLEFVADQGPWISLHDDVQTVITEMEEDGMVVNETFLKAILVLRIVLGELRLANRTRWNLKYLEVDERMLDLMLVLTGSRSIPGTTARK